jgi:GxxExxY protein
MWLTSAINEAHRFHDHPLSLNYKGVVLDCGYRLDLLVEDKVIVELKSIEGLEPIHEAQMLTYLNG